EAGMRRNASTGRPQGRGRRALLAVCWLGASLSTTAPAIAQGLPAGFVYLRDVDPTIVQDMRYHGEHNFMGRRVSGYDAGECILTRKAAEALRSVQARMREVDRSLRVHDCYRPERA